MPNKDPLLASNIILAKGGVIEVEGGTDIFSVSASGTVDMSLNWHTNGQTLLVNAGQAVTASGRAPAATGAMTLATNLSSKVMTYAIPWLKVGDEIVGFRIVGALGATGGQATVLDADLRKTTKGAGALTDASVGAITQVSVTADTALDAAKVFTTVETVATDYMYYVVVTGTTANNAACDIAVQGIEVDVNRK